MLLLLPWQLLTSYQKLATAHMFAAKFKSFMSAPQLIADISLPTQLLSLGLQSNQLIGTLPASWGNLSSVSWIHARVMSTLFCKVLHNVQCCVCRTSKALFEDVSCTWPSFGFSAQMSKCHAAIDIWYWKKPSVRASTIAMLSCCSKTTDCWLLHICFLSCFKSCQVATKYWHLTTNAVAWSGRAV